MAYPEPLERLIAAFERFPGVGRRTAERLAFHALRDPAARELGPALARAVSETKLCGSCCNVTRASPCEICSDAARDAATICVVEHPKDVEAIERSKVFRGRYHVLMGALNPADGSEAEHLFLRPLVERVRRESTREVILATDPDAEGEATARLVLAELSRAGLAPRVTRMARGLPAGAAIEYLHRGVLEDALEGRVELVMPVRGPAPDAGRPR
jgi:recombination protein RecR